MKNILLQEYLNGHSKVLVNSRLRSKFNSKIEKFKELNQEKTSDEFFTELDLQVPEAKFMHQAILLWRLAQIQRNTRIIATILVISVVLAIVSALAGVISI